MRFWIPLLLTLPFLVMPAAGQASTLTLWAHGNADNGEIIWMNADADDARATDTANGPGYCPEPYATAEECGLSVQGVRPVGTFEHTFTMAMDPALAGPVELASGAKATFEVVFGANSGSCEGTFTSKLALGTTTVAEAADVEFDFTNGYVTFTATADIKATAIGDGGALQWTIAVECTGSGLFLGVHADTGRSKITLPAASLPEPEPEVGRDIRFFDLDAPANVAVSFANATDFTYTYNWTNEFANASLSYDVQLRVGSLEFWLIDGADGSAFRHTFDASANTTEEGSWEPGIWQLRVNGTGFAGNLTVQVSETGQPAPPPPTSSSGPSPSNTSSTSPTNSTTSSAAPKDTPGPAALMVLIAVAAAAWAARRRT